MLERGGQKGSIGAERMRETSEGLLQMSRMEKLVAWPGMTVIEMEREEMDLGCTEEEDLAGLGYLALGSEGAVGAGMTQSFWCGQMGGWWHHLLS